MDPLRSFSFIYCDISANKEASLLEAFPHYRPLAASAVSISRPLPFLLQPTMSPVFSVDMQRGTLVVGQRRERRMKERQ